MKPLKTAAILTWRFMRAVAHVFFRGNGIQHAGTIAYFSLLSIIPLVLLLAAILAWLTMGNPLAGETSPIDQILQPMEVALPHLTGKARQLLVSISESHTSLNIVNILILLFAASAAFNALEGGLNAMLRTERRRHFLLGKLIFAAFLTVGAATLFIWQFMKSVVVEWLSAASVDVPDWLAKSVILGQIIELALLTVSFYLCVKFLSTERYARLPRWIGALSFAVLFRLARLGLDLYLAHVATLEQVYGTAATFVGLIIWLFVGSVVILVSSAIIRASDDLLAGRLKNGNVKETL